MRDVVRRAATALAAFATVVAAHVAAAGETARPLADVLAAAKAQDKPALLDFGAVWCIPCKMLAKELAAAEVKPLLERFVPVSYDAERGEGRKAADRYHVTSYPTLVVVDGEGHELARQNGLNRDALPIWLKEWGDAGGRETDLRQRGQAGDVDALLALAARAESQHDVAQQKKWLAAAESADRSPTRAAAARAAWQRLELDARAKVDAVVSPLLLDYAARFPTHSTRALELATRAGTDRKLLASAFDKAIAGTDDADTLNLLAYAALDAGARDGAVRAAEKQQKLKPDDANAWDTLAEMLSARGEKARAIELEKKAIAMVKPEQQAVLQENLARFEKGEPYQDFEHPSLAQLIFGDEEPDFKMPPPSAADVAHRMYAHESARVAQACAAKAPPGLDETYVRLRVGKSPHAEKIEVLEPRATAAFKRCVETAVRAIAVPPDSEPAELVVGFELHPPKLPPEFMTQ